MALPGSTTMPLAAALALALAGEAEPAAAAAPAGEAEAPLRWHAPAGCPDQAEVKARLARALGPEVEPPRVEADVSADDDGRFHATVVLRGSWGETVRRLDSPTCDTLADAVVLLAAVSVSTAGEPVVLAVPEPDAIEPEVEASPEVEPTPAPAPTEPEPVAEPIEPAPPDTPPIEPPTGRSRAADAAEGSVLRGLVRLEARAGAGLLPTVDLGGAAIVGLSHRWFRIELGAAGWLPRERTVAPEARVRASAWAVELRGYATLRPRSWLEVLPCAEVDVGVLRGEGLGAAVARGRDVSQTWAAIGLGPAVSLRLHPLVALFAGATMIVPVRRVGVDLAGLPGDADAHRMAPVAGRGALGLEVNFP